jgi:Glycosyl hydrolase family 20, domain 2
MANRAKVLDAKAPKGIVIPTPQKFSWGRILALLSIVLAILVVLGREFYKVAMPEGLGGNVYIPTPEPEATPEEKVYVRTPHAPKKITKIQENPFKVYSAAIWVEGQQPQDVRGARILHRGVNDSLPPIPENSSTWKPELPTFVEKAEANVYFLKATTPQSPESYHVRVTAKLIEITAPDEDGWVWGAKAVVGMMVRPPGEADYHIPSMEIDG